MRRLVLSAILLVLATAVSFPPATISADEPEDFDPRQQRRLFGVRDTNAARYAIEEARRALADGRTQRALEVCQQVLDDMRGDFFLEEEASRPESVLWSSAPEVVREILAGLDTEQRSVYERLTAPAARPLLERALRTREPSVLVEIIARFGASEAGRVATRVLAEIQLESGRPRDAALTLREGLRYDPEDTHAWTRLIHALELAGERRALAELPVPEALVPRRDAALARIPPREGARGWPFWGGNAARDGVHPERTTPPTHLRAREHTDWQLRGIERGSVRFRGVPPGEGPYRSMLPTFRPMHPVVDGRTMFVADGRGVRAFDVYSAREVWRFDHRTESALAMLETGEPHYGRTSLSRAFAPVVADDLVIATVEVAVPYTPEYLQGYEITTYLPRRIIVALEKDTGRLRWWMGRDGLDRLQLGDTSIVSAPAVSEGLVVAVGDTHRGNHNVSFLAFDLETGALRWRRPLGFGQQELNLFGYPLKELAASPVAIADGVAYASTGLGFVAAVDVRSGVPRWLASYDIVPIHKVQLWYDAPVRPPQHAPAPPIVHGGRLVLAPTEGEHVHVFDKDSGKLLWRKPYARGRMSYASQGQLIGVANDGRRDVVLLTDHDLRARDLVSGETVWRGRFDPEGDRVVGQGAVAGDDVLVPTTEGLQRFSLSDEGAYRGTVPWPDGALPGNILPLPRVLIVTTRDDVQWFYDWAALEREVAKRRAERPDDPTILLEAGEMYLRGGGEIQRAREAFEEARRVADRAAPDLVPRAVEGLYRTWLTDGDDQAGDPERAVASYRKALEHAQDAEERVLARIRIHRALLQLDGAARVANLEALVEEAGEAYGRFDPDADPLPAAAAALFIIAREHLAASRPEAAVDALQRILIEEPTAPFPGGVGATLARETIGEILAQAGPAVYRRHEERARALLQRARAEQDAVLIERLLREYPNAEVVTDALLERARGLLEEERPLDAAGYLQRLLRGAPADHRLVPTALAALARSYRLAGARGAARATLDRLAEQYPDAELAWDDRTWTGASFAAAERAAVAAPPADAAPEMTLRAPLEEVHFELVGDEEQARQIDVVGDTTAGPDAPPAPVAVMMHGESMTVIDLRKGAVAWSARTGFCQRAAYAEGVLIVALTRELRGYDAASGEQLWSRETEARTQDLVVGGGLAFAHLQDMRRAGRGAQRLEALDVAQGSVVWTQPLARADYRGLAAHGDHVLLQQVDYRNSRARPRLLVFQDFDGTRRSAVDIPLAVEGLPIVAGERYVIAGRTGKPLEDGRGEARALAAIELATGQLRWMRGLPGTEGVCGITAEGEELVVLRTDGGLSTHALEDGRVLGRTRLYITDRGRSCPFPNTPILLQGDRLTMLPWARRPDFGVVSFDRRTGKLAWDRPFADSVSPSRATLLQRGDVVCTMISYPKGQVQRVLLRLLDARTGALIQEIEPEALSKDRWIPTMAEGYGTLVLFGKHGASIFRPR